ncbi:nucleotidyltransferase family protein [Nostoc sp. NZL]|uniref:nucleotidyltransferase family protein n=1 Tax=Nostoc sp. NZL TaxID=2650612 RepID=UPI0018C659B0|nr:nucleotidyltransferase family protein [Nostoc sp. NZL]MBG1243337.1 nucleotidyltransferase family protein [Nostoc sp. NZL]
MLKLDPNQKKIAIAILAAGKGSRFNGDCPKPLALFQGRSLLCHALTAAINSKLGPILLVVGYQHQQVATAAANVLIVHNPDWQRGIASSLQTAIQVIEPDFTIGALCVGLADQPLIGAEAYRRLACAYHQGVSFAVATYKGARRNPVLLGRGMWPEVMHLTGDEGARALMKSYPVMEVACDRTGNPLDIDTTADLQVLETNILSYSS